MRSESPLMIVGYGSVGQYLLDMILTDPNHQYYNNVVVVSRKTPEQVAPRINTSIVSGMIRNYSQDKISVIYEQCDLSDTEKMVEIIDKYKPSQVVQCARFFAGIKYGAYSYKNDIGYGVWSPMSVVPIYNLMKAVKLSESKPQVINTSFPDVTNSWIASSNLGIAPICGAGNINHLIPRIKLAWQYINETDEVPKVDLICSHYTNTYVSKEGNPKGYGYLLKINGKELSVEESLNIFKHCNLPMESGQTRNLMIASDCYAITKGVSQEMHIPGPNGIPGGCNCRLTYKSNKLEIDTIETSQAKLYSLNMIGIKLDGIENIINGEIFFTEEARRGMRDVFGIEYPKSIKIEDAEEFANLIKESLINYDNSRSNLSD